MKGYVVERGRLGELDTVAVSNPATGSLLEVALRGATPLRWRAVLDGDAFDLLDGYVDEAELLSQVGARNAVMAPWSNRIEDATYTFDGIHHDLQPGKPAGERVAIHGFVRELHCTVADTELNQERARLTLSTDALRPGAFDGYPFSVDVEVVYTLTTNTVRLDVTGRNVGDGGAPFAAGWHPYLRLTEGRIDDLVLHVPGRKVVHTDPALIPLPGAAALGDVDGTDVDFGRPRPIGSGPLDHALTDLDPDRPTTLHDPDSGRRIELTQTGRVVQVFTGDALSRDPRGAVAIEPLEVMTNAFNRPDCTDAITLAAGSERTFSCAVRLIATTPPA